MISLFLKVVVGVLTIVCFSFAESTKKNLESNMQQNCNITKFNGSSMITLNHHEGNITSPNYGSGMEYFNNQFCVWGFAIQPQDQLLSTIFKIQTKKKKDGPCFDYLQLPNGTRLCGNQKSKSYLVCYQKKEYCDNVSELKSQFEHFEIITSQWPPNITFNSDRIYGDDGFFLNYSIVVRSPKVSPKYCNISTFNGSTMVLNQARGNVTSPNYREGKKYFDTNQFCVWKFAIQQQYSLLIDIVFLNLKQMHNGSCFDYLQLPNGERLCGNLKSKSYLVCYQKKEYCDNVSELKSQFDHFKIITSQWPPNITFNLDLIYGYEGFFLNYSIVIKNQKKISAGLSVSNIIIIAFLSIACVMSLTIIGICRKRKDKKQRKDESPLPPVDSAVYAVAQDVKEISLHPSAINNVPSSSSSARRDVNERNYETVLPYSISDPIVRVGNAAGHKMMVHNELYQPLERSGQNQDSSST